SAPISETNVQWWKSPTTPRPLTDWIWFKASDRSPFRLQFQKPNDRLSILSAFALSTQVAFEALPEAIWRRSARHVRLPRPPPSHRCPSTKCSIACSPRTRPPIPTSGACSQNSHPAVLLHRDPVGPRRLA